MAGYGLLRLERGEHGRITPQVMHDRVELDLPPAWPRKAGRQREIVWVVSAWGQTGRWPQPQAQNRPRSRSRS